MKTTSSKGVLILLRRDFQNSGDSANVHTASTRSPRETSQVRTSLSISAGGGRSETKRVANLVIKCRAVDGCSLSISKTSIPSSMPRPAGSWTPKTVFGSLSC